MEQRLLDRRINSRVLFNSLPKPARCSPPGIVIKGLRDRLPLLLLCPFRIPVECQPTCEPGQEVRAHRKGIEEFPEMNDAVFHVTIQTLIVGEESSQEVAG